MKRTNWLWAMTAAGAVLCLMLRAAAAEGMNGLVGWLPDGTNAILAADVGYLRDSPQIGQMRWVARGSTGTAALLPSLQGVGHVCIAAHLDLDRLQPDWQLGLIEMRQQAPSIDELAKANGGYTDTIGGVPVAWCTRGACFVRLDDHTLASAQPADRQTIARWLESRRSMANAAGQQAAYLKAAAGLVNQQSPIVIAVDLRDAFSEGGLTRWLQLDPPEAAAGITEPRPVAKALASSQGVMLRVSVADQSSAVATTDFGAPIATLSELARPLFLDLLTRRGLSVADINNWTFSIAGQSVTSQGALSPQGLRQIVSLLQAPSPAEPASAASGGGTRGAKSANLSPAAASARYFNEISAMLDGVNQSASSLGAQGGWLRRDANRIDQLPIGGVDPDLASWGAQVSATLRQAAAMFDAGQQQVLARSQSAQAPMATYSTGYDDAGAAQRDAQYRTAIENYRRQNREATAQIRAQVYQQVTQPLQAAQDSRAKIRVTMTSRYGPLFH